MTHDREQERIAERIAAHRGDCSECDGETMAALQIAAALARSTPPVDAAALSALTLARVSTDLAARAQAVFRRQVMVVLLLALVPLPGLLFFGYHALRLGYQTIATVIPASLAEYLAVSYGLAALVVLTASYATIPLLLERLRVQPLPARSS